MESNDNKSNTGEDFTGNHDVRSFIKSLLECSPLLSCLDYKKTGGEHNPEVIVSLIGRHESITAEIFEGLNLRRDSASGAVHRDSIGRVSTELISSGLFSFDEKNDAAAVRSMISSLNDEGVISPSYVASIIEDDFVSEDILVVVKLTLLKSSMRFLNFTEMLGANNKQQNEAITWLCKTSVLLAKDLAFNWDKSCAFKDREGLFKAALPICADVAYESWVDVLCSKSESAVSLSSPSSVWDRLSGFTSIIESEDYGYATHETYNLEWLKKNLEQLILTLIISVHSEDISPIKVNSLRSEFLDYLEPRLIEAWTNSGSLLVAEIQKKVEEMSEIEFAEWQKNEGARPMPINLIYKGLKDSMDKTPFYLSIAPDKLSAERIAKKRLARLWGLSEAVCSVRGQ